MVNLSGLLPWAAVRALRAELEAAGCPDAGYDAAYLVELVTGRPPRFDETPLIPAQADRLIQLASRRCQREPLQYLSGLWDFLSVTLSVGIGVLCPRPDTEVVCEAAARCIRNLPSPQVLDLCAGTGCIGIGIKSLVPEAQVTCLEKSPDALPYLRENAVRYGVTALEGDLFGWEKSVPEHSLDLVVSNPPYLTAAEMEELQPEVRWEPAMALAAGEDGLDFYRYLAAHYGKVLKNGGWLVLEIGWQQRSAVEELLKVCGWENISTQKDYNGNDRTVLAQNFYN